MTPYQSLVQAMRRFVEAGVRVVEGDSPEKALERRENLLREFSRFCFSSECKEMADKFAEHISEFREYHKLTEENQRK